MIISVSVPPPVLPQLQVEDPGHSAKSAHIHPTYVTLNEVTL